MKKRLVALCPCGHFQSIHEDWRPLLGATDVTFDCDHCGMTGPQTITEAVLSDVQGPPENGVTQSRAIRSLDAVKHCFDKMTSEEMAADMRMRNTPPTGWAIEDMERIIGADRRINGPDITYAHKSDPNGPRFRQPSSHPTPPWAVEIRQES